jgi:hypothetical protein
MIEVVGVLVAAADREHASPEHIDKAVHDPRRIAPIREHPGQIVGQTETPLGHRQKHHAAIRGQAAAIEGSCDFLGVNGIISPSPSARTKAGLMKAGWVRQQIEPQQQPGVMAFGGHEARTGFFGN